MERPDGGPASGSPEAVIVTIISNLLTDLVARNDRVWRLPHARCLHSPYSLSCPLIPTTHTSAIPINQRMPHPHTAHVSPTTVPYKPFGALKSLGALKAVPSRADASHAVSFINTTRNHSEELLGGSVPAPMPQLLMIACWVVLRNSPF